MVIHENYVDSHLRSIKLSIMGKSNDAQEGAISVIQGITRFIHGLREEDQSYDLLVEMIEKLSRELPTITEEPLHRRWEDLG